MASKVNSEFAYITVVNGLTPWERIRTIRNFIEDRTIALTIKDTISVKVDAAKAELEAWEYEMSRDDIGTKDKLLAKAKYLEALAKRMENEAFAAQQKDGYDKLDEELAFLIKYEKELANICENTRLPGKTDSEMYELNKPLEDLMRHTKAVEVDILSKVLQLSRDVVENGIKNPLFYNKMKNTHEAMQLPVPQKIQLGDSMDTIDSKLSVYHMYIDSSAGASGDKLYNAALSAFSLKQKTLMANGIQLDKIPDTIGDHTFKNTNINALEYDASTMKNLLCLNVD